MKTFLAVFTLKLLLTGSFAKSDLIKTSVREIIASEFTRSSLYFLYDEATDANFVNQVLSSLVNVKVQIESFDQLKKFPEKRRDAIIFVNNFNSFLSLNAVLTDDLFNFDGLFLIVGDKAMESHANAIFKIFWEKFIYNVNLLVYEETSATLLTFLPFTNESCFDTFAKVINVFDLKSLKWTGKGFFPRKLENLYNCPLRVGTYEYANAVITSKLENGSIQFKGSDIELINSLSEILNFQVDFRFVSHNGGWGELFENGTSTGSFKMLMDNLTDVTIGWGILTYWKLFNVSSSEDYFMVPLGFVIPTGRQFTSIEKLLIPFRPLVWIMVLIVMFAAVFVILLVENRAKRWRDIVIGREVKAPLMGLIAAVFGGSSHSLPRQQFPRYLLMMFLLYCLVMRTLYQSGLFKFIQSTKKYGVSSINEMVEEKYQIYSYVCYENIWSHLSFNKITTSESATEIEKLRMKTLDSDNKIAIITSFDEIVYLNKLNLNKFSFNVCKEHILMLQVVAFFQKNSYLKQPFDKKLSILKSNGLINFWISKYGSYRDYLVIHQPKKGPEKLNFVQVFGCFEVCAVCLLFSTLVFILELMIYKTRRNV